MIREPFAKMPCGKPVLGMADTIVLNDPIAGQGSNNAGKCAEIYLNLFFTACPINEMFFIDSKYGAGQ